MPFNHRTPESLIGRSDSKNPATTCKGITTNGKPCRRSLASPKSSPKAASRLQSGVVAVLHEEGLTSTDAVFYCWQHKDQTEGIAQQDATNKVRPRLIPVDERTSIDSLVARLGVMQVDIKEPRKHGPLYTKTRPDHADNRPCRHVRPVLIDQGQDGSSPRIQPPRKRCFWSSLCCITQSSGDNDDDYLELVRHKQRTDVKSLPIRDSVISLTPESPRRATHMAGIQSVQRPQRSEMPSLPRRQPLAGLRGQLPAPNPPQALAETPNVLSWIPSYLPPLTASTLLSELSKPISPYDKEGYIYIFWLTPNIRNPPGSVAASLLASHADRNERISDVMSSYSTTPPSPSNDHKRTIMLKIGRANNVHRRMTEWTRQCGYDLSLVRFYPYVASSPSPSPSSSPTRQNARSSPQRMYPDLSRPLADRQSSDQQQVRKVPYAHKVERLVHLELAERRVKRLCEQCGKEHREWFEVSATEDGVKAVDDVVRRWVRWAEVANRTS